MKKLIIVAASFGGILLFLLASLPFLGSGPARPKNVVIPEISNRVNAFTLDLLKHYADGADAKDNAILSPQSVFCGLAATRARTASEANPVFQKAGATQ